jgi:uncharacterized membrane protein YgaE (UPF0421/DUF939 family)
MNERIKTPLIYAIKCVMGILLVFIISRLIGYSDISWALISVILVLSPDSKEAVSLAMTRIKANVLGAGISALCLLVYPANMWIMSLSVAVTLSLCYVLKLEAGVRSAMAAALIMERIISVLAGCLLGLVITFVFHFRVKGVEKTSVSPVIKDE